MCSTKDLAVCQLPRSSTVGSIDLHDYQIASMVSPRIRGKLRWIQERWLTRSREVNLCMAPRRCLLICKELRRGTRGIQSYSFMFFPGSTL